MQLIFLRFPNHSVLFTIKLLRPLYGYSPSPPLPVMKLEEIVSDTAEASNDVTQADDESILNEEIVQEADDPRAGHDETTN